MQWAYERPDVQCNRPQLGLKHDRPTKGPMYDAIGILRSTQAY